MIFKETIHKVDGTKETTQFEFKSRALLIKNLRRKIHLPSQKLYELWKFNKTTVEYGGVKRDIEICDKA